MVDSGDTRIAAVTDGTALQKHKIFEAARENPFTATIKRLLSEDEPILARALVSGHRLPRCLEGEFAPNT